MHFPWVNWMDNTRHSFNWTLSATVTGKFPPTVWSFQTDPVVCQSLQVSGVIKKICVQIKLNQKICVQIKLSIAKVYPVNLAHGLETSFGLQSNPIQIPESIYFNSKNPYHLLTRHNATHPHIHLFLPTNTTHKGREGDTKLVYFVCGILFPFCLSRGQSYVSFVWEGFAPPAQPLSTGEGRLPYARHRRRNRHSKTRSPRQT